MNQTNPQPKPDWQALHLQLQDALAGYADDMLNQQERAQVEAHLAGCDACRQDLARQQLLCQRLQQIPPTGMSAQMFQRLDQAIQAAPAPAQRRLPRRHKWLGFLRWPTRSAFGWPMVAASSGWAVAIMLLVVMLTPSLPPQKSSLNVPMVQDVLAQYQHYIRSPLPRPNHATKLRAPANWPGSHLLASWQTNIGGAPAQAFAVRNGDSVILQFRVDESVFFHNPDVRQLVAQQGQFEMQQQNLSVLGIPLQRAGLLMVGPVNRIPPPNKLTLNKSAF